MNFKDNHKKTGFKVPNGYFKDSEELHLNLHSISKIKFNFKTPSNYFMTSQEQLEKLALSSKKKSSVIQFIPYAAMLAACFIVSFLIINPKTEAFTDEALEFYFNEQENNLSTNEFLEFSSDDLLASGVNESIEKLSLEAIFEQYRAYNTNFNIIDKYYEN